MIDTSIIEYLLRERPRHLLLLVEGVSLYNKSSLKNIPMNREQSILMGMARRHIEFRDRFGDVENAIIGHEVYCQYPDEFEAWLNLGCPGIDEDVLNAYIEKNPLYTSKSQWELKC